MSCWTGTDSRPPVEVIVLGVKEKICKFSLTLQGNPVRRIMPGHRIEAFSCNSPITLTGSVALQEAFRVLDAVIMVASITHSKNNTLIYK